MMLKKKEDSERIIKVNDIVHQMTKHSEYKKNK